MFTVSIHFPGEAAVTVWGHTQEQGCDLSTRKGSMIWKIPKRIYSTVLDLGALTK